MINFPYEGQKHSATIIMLPYREDIWLNAGEDARKTILDMAKIITQYEKLILIVDPSIIDIVKKNFNLTNVSIIEAKYNDAWARDIMPIFVIENNKVKAISFDFNAWGGKIDGLYENYEDDRKIKTTICQKLGITEKKVPFILEGGSINTNGKGVLITTEACLLSKGRNPKYSKEEIETILKENLGLNEVIWLENGIVEDETNEHVDNMAVFLDENTIALASSDKGQQAKYSKSAYDKLVKLGYSVIKIPVPEPDLFLTEDEEKLIVIDSEAKQRLSNAKLAASYINFYQSDKYILLPQFGVKEDNIAYNILNNFYQGNKKIYRINSRSILVSGGNIHCITMQIPEVKYESKN